MTDLLVVIGSVTAEQYEPVRLLMISRGLDPEVTRIATSRWKSFYPEAYRHSNDLRITDDWEVQHMMLRNLCNRFEKAVGFDPRQVRGAVVCKRKLFPTVGLRNIVEGILPYYDHPKGQYFRDHFIITP